MATQIAIGNGRYADACELNEKAIELYEGDERGYAALCLRQGYLNTLEGNYREALKWLDNGLAIEPSPEARLTRAQIRVNLGDPQGALKDLEVYLASGTMPWQTLPNIVNIYEAAGEYETAADCYAELEQRTGEAEYLLDRAYCLTNLGNMEDAAAECARYAEAGGQETASADVMLGLGWMRCGGYEEAKACFLSAVENGYSDPQALCYYVTLCGYVTEDYPLACSYGDMAIEEIRNGGTADMAEIRMDGGTGRLMVELAETDVPMLCLMTGAAHLRSEEYGPAVDCLNLCLEREPEDAFAYYLRGSALLAGNRYEEAEADFSAAIDAGEDPEHCRYGRAVCRMQTGDSAGAAEDFAWVMRNGKDASLAAEAAFLRGKLFLDGGVRYFEAMRCFTAAIEAGVESEQSHYGRGVCRMRTGDRAGAMDDLDWVLLHGEDGELFEQASQLMAELMQKPAAAGKPD